jgi:predicted RNA binding protein YcfA (HicA-like mRNA interferase family)
VSAWPSAKARQVLKALNRIGWKEVRRTGSHRVLSRQGWTNYVFPFHDGVEIGPHMLARIAKQTGLKHEDLG